MVKVSFTVRVDKELHHKLEDRANELGISKTKLVEKIIADYFDYTLKDDPIFPLEKISLKIRQLEHRLARLESMIGLNDNGGADG